jgi:hypothetical protein
MLNERAAELAAIPGVTVEWKYPRQSGRVLIASVDGRPIAFLTGAAAETMEQSLRARERAAE